MHDSLQTFSMIWAPSSEFVSSSIPSWQISTAHVQPFRGARDLVFCLTVPLDSLLVWASSEGSGETARMRRLAWTFAARIGDKYQILLTRSICQLLAKVSDLCTGYLSLLRNSASQVAYETELSGTPTAVFTEIQLIGQFPVLGIIILI